jgi:hypothetical protein
VQSSPAGISCTDSCSSSFASGQTVTLTAVAASGYVFGGWSGACSGSGLSCTVTMTAEGSVVALFTPAKSACSDFYPSGFALVGGQVAPPIGAVGRLTKGVAFRDPAFGTCVVRASNHAVEPPSGFARNDYSRRQAFNADSSRFIVYALDGFWHVYNAVTLAHVKQLSGPAGDAEPQWHPTNPDLLYFLPTNGVGMQLRELNVVTDQVRVVGDFGARLRARWPGANAAWTKSEGSPSADARYWCFMVDNASWASLGVFTWDRDTDTITGTYNTNGDRPDNVSMSPSGNYCVVGGDSARGTVAFSRDFSQQRQIHHKVEHVDIALDANGDDAYVAIDYQSAGGDVFMVNLRTGVRTVLFPTYLSGSTTALHMSGKAYNKRGWVLISTYADSGSLQWLHRKIFAVQLSANPLVHGLAHHHSRFNKYWTEPHASVNRDFTRVLFNSNWGTGSADDVDAYMIVLPRRWLP